MKKTIFTGAATAVATPFCDGNVDYAAMERLLARQSEAGIGAVVVTGTTGEAATLSLAEKRALWRLCASTVGEKAVVIAGIGSNCTENAAKAARSAAREGADAVLAVTPYYNKCTQEGLYRHYLAIAEASPVPVIVYNVPSRTGVDIGVETCCRLAAHPNINGIKEAGGDLAKIARLCRLCGEDFSVWSGNDDTITAAMAIGAKGAISVLGNLRPEALRRLCDSALRGDFSESAAVQSACLPLIDALFCEVNPIPLKYALAAEGLCRDELRLPLTPLSEGKREVVRAALRAC